VPIHLSFRNLGAHGLIDIHQELILLDGFLKPSAQLGFAESLHQLAFGNLQKCELGVRKGAFT